MGGPWGFPLQSRMREGALDTQQQNSETTFASLRSLLVESRLDCEPRCSARFGGRSGPCSALKGETVPDSLPATPKSPPTP